MVTVMQKADGLLGKLARGQECLFIDLQYFIH